MPTGPACGWRQGKILGRRGRRAGDGHRNPAMQTGALPDGERRAVVAVPPSPHAGPDFGGKNPRCRCQLLKDTAAGRKRRTGRGRSQQTTAHRTGQAHTTDRRPPCALADRQDRGANGTGRTRTRPAGSRPRRREPRADPPTPGARLPSRPPRRHADCFVRSCALTCDIRIGPSENSPTLAFSVRPRK